MPRDGGGVYALPANTTVTTATTIESSPYNTFLADIVSMMNEDRPVVAGGTGASTAEAARDNLSVRDLRVKTTAGSSNAYTVTSGDTLTPGQGDVILIKANHDNTGGATLNVDSQGAVAIVKEIAGSETALAAGDLETNGHYLLSYDTTTPSWRLLNPSTLDATLLPSSVVTLTGTQTLTNKTLTTPVIQAIDGSGGLVDLRGTPGSISLRATETYVDINQFLRHRGDSDTLLEFGTDTVTIDAGGVEGLNMTATALTLGDTAQAVTIDGSAITLSPATINVPAEIVHTGDTDTKIGFTADTVTLTAGGVAATFTASGLTLPAGATVDNIETTLTDDDTHLPTSGAVADYVSGVHTMPLPAAGMVARSTNGAAYVEAELATNDIMVAGFDFDASTDEAVQVFIPQMPAGWDEGTFTAEVTWTNGTTAGSGDVVWGVRAVCIGNDDALDVAFGTAQTVTDTFIASGDLHRTSATSAITAGGSPAAGDAMVLEVYRDADNGSDTYTQDARLLGVAVNLTLDVKDA